VQELKQRIERDEKLFEFNPAIDDVFCVSSLLKLYLRELPEPLFRFPVQERLQHTESRDEHIHNDFQVLRSKMRRLHPVHQATLRVLIEHLAHVTSRCQVNKMDARNLAIVFGSVIFGEDEMAKGTDLLSMQSWKDTVLEDLINFCPILFDDGRPPPSPASAVVPLPHLDPPLVVSYGSNYTRTNPNLRVAVPSKESDFAPPLPQRPPPSIHPSRITNPASRVSTPTEQSPPRLPRRPQNPDTAGTPLSPLSFGYPGEASAPSSMEQGMLNVTSDAKSDSTVVPATPNTPSDVDEPFEMITSPTVRAVSSTPSTMSPTNEPIPPHQPLAFDSEPRT